MMKIYLTSALIGSMTLLSACSESPYSPPIGQTGVNPNMQYPTNVPANVNGMPINNQFPNNQFPQNNMQNPCIGGVNTMVYPNPCTTATTVSTNTNYQYRLQAYLQLQNSCRPVAITRSQACRSIAVDCDRIRVVRRKVKVKSCNCYKYVYVTEGAPVQPAPKTSQPAPANDLQPGERRADNTAPAATEPKPTDVLNETDLKNNDENNSIKPTNVMGENEVAPEEIVESKGSLKTISIPLTGSDARELYERMALTPVQDVTLDGNKDKNSKTIRGANIECSQTGGKGNDDHYKCMLHVAMSEDKVAQKESGEVLPIRDPSKAGSPRKTKANAYNGMNVKIAKDATEGAIRLYNGTEELMAALPGPDQIVTIDPEAKITARVRMGKNMKCYRTLKLAKNVSECEILIALSSGEAQKPISNAVAADGK